jgi:hypothetical protein
VTFLTPARQPTATKTPVSVPSIPTPAEVSGETATVPASSSAVDATVTPTSTALPDNVIRVDTLEQEVYPFIENGKCSFGEAIITANSGEPVDSCAAGIQGESVID